MPTNSKDFSTKNGMDVNNSFITNSDVYLDSDKYVSMFSSDETQYLLTVEDNGSLSTTKVYSIGETGPGGGIVFYDAGTANTWGRYLEAAPITWYGGSADPNLQWSSNADISVSTQTIIGSGSTNTANMIASITSSAALGSKNYQGGGKTDWFLPSKDELYELYLRRNIVNIPSGLSNANDIYWSSSQGTFFFSAWTRRPWNGEESGSANKTINHKVRPIRAF